MFARLGSFTYRRRGWVLLAAGLFAVVAAALGPAVSDLVKGGGFADPAAESTKAAEALAETFGPGVGDMVVIWSNDALSPEDPEFAATVTDLLAAVPADAVNRVVHPWTPGLPDDVRAGLLGADGHTVMAAFGLAGADDEELRDAYLSIRDDVQAPDGWTTAIAGSQPIFTEMQERAETDIARAEMLAMPILLVLLAIIFGGLVAAALPVVIGVVAILGAMLLLRGVAQVTDVSTFALNVATILGLGLAIDYSLFVVSRFREEVRRSGDVGAAVSRTVATAGRTVAFSGLTVLIAFGGLLFFPQMFMRSMGLGGIAVVLVDVTLALTLLPALLAWLGPRVDAGRLPRSLTERLSRRRRGIPDQRPVATAPGGTSPAAGDALVGVGWARVSRLVLRRPVPVVVGVTALLALIALPAFDLNAGETDVTDLPKTSVARQADELLAEQFPHTAATTIDVVVTGDVTPEALTSYLGSVAALPAVTDVGVVGQADGVTHIEVRTGGEPSEPATTDLVHGLRERAGPAGTEVLVGGIGAAGVDSVAAITRVLPWTLLFVAGVTLVLLFGALGSVVLPIKAVLMNVVSLGATLGMIAWGFSQGHLAGALGFTPSGKVEAANLVLIGLIAFGLAMDYELFLLSRVREERLHGADDRTAIALGLQRSGRTITSAALLLVVVLAAMVTSSVTFLKLIGLGLAFAVAVDATVVRALLVPATVRLLGRASWWLPAPLARLHARLDLGESDDVAAVPIPDAAPEHALVDARR
jgi:RND superfamily putative drug exporter